MRAVCLVAALALGACASAPEPVPAGVPDVRMTAGLPAPPQAQLYADCVAQAAETGSYQRERDGGTLRFTCTGDTAKWFHDALGPWAASQGSEYVAEGRTWRFSRKLIKDPYGIDGCSTDGAGDYQCVVILAVGAFIEQLDYKVPER